MEFLSITRFDLTAFYSKDKPNIAHAVIVVVDNEKTQWIMEKLDVNDKKSGLLLVEFDTYNISSDMDKYTIFKILDFVQNIKPYTQYLLFGDNMVYRSDGIIAGIARLMRLNTPQYLTTSTQKQICATVLHYADEARQNLRLF